MLFRSKAALDNLVKEKLADVCEDNEYHISDNNLDEGTSSLNEQGIKVSGVYEDYNDGKFESSVDGAGESSYGVDYYGYDRLKYNLYRKEIK